MPPSEEALLVWRKALRKLDEATAAPAAAFPGIAIVSSYFAMRNAAVAVLLTLNGRAPSAETAIIAGFGAAVGSAGFEHGQAFNRAFDLRNVEDYDAVASPTPDEAQTVRADAAALIAYCAQRFGFPLEAGGGTPT